MPSPHHRLSLASLYLFLALITAASLLNTNTGNIGFAAAVVDAGQIVSGVEDCCDDLSLSSVVSALSLFTAPASKQEANTLRQRYLFSLRLIRAPPQQPV